MSSVMIMNFTLKRRLTYVTIAFLFLFTGVEYAVIFPTIWAYLQQLGAKNSNLLGFTVAAFSVSPMLVSPVIGKWFDNCHNARLILAIMNIFEIIGSLLYFISFSPWFIVFSRFICGLGSSAVLAVLADISHSTTIEDRTAVMANFQACRQIGLLIGPAFNLFLRQLHFKIGPFVVNKLTAPGIFMAVIGIVLEVLFLAFYHNLIALSNDEQLTESLHHSSAGERVVPRSHTSCNVESPYYVSLNHDPEVDYIADEDVQHLICSTSDLVANCEGDRPRDPSKHLQYLDREKLLHTVYHSSLSCDSNEMIESAENFMGSASESSLCTPRSRPSSGSSKLEDSRGPDVEVTCSNNIGSHTPSYPNDVTTNELHGCAPSRPSFYLQLHLYANEFLRDEVIALLGLTFVTMFAQLSLETIVTPLTQRLFHFGDFENSLFFLFAGIEILFAFLLVNLLSKRFEDRVLILTGSILMICSLSWYLTFVPHLHPGIEYSASLSYFAVGVFINLLGIAMLIACCTSLYSKLISKDNQGVGHGVRRTVLSAGMILGPLWGGATVNVPTVLFSIPLAVVLVFTLLFCVSFKRLRVAAVVPQDSITPHITNDETTPLLIKT